MTRHIQIIDNAWRCLRCGKRAVKWWVPAGEDQHGVCGRCIRKAEREGAERA